MMLPIPAQLLSQLQQGPQVIPLSQILQQLPQQQQQQPIFIPQQPQQEQQIFYQPQQEQQMFYQPQAAIYQQQQQVQQQQPQIFYPQQQPQQQQVRGEELFIIKKFRMKKTTQGPCTMFTPFTFIKIHLLEWKPIYRVEEERE